MTFADKKAADEYDRMLDMADNLTALFETSEIDMDDKFKEDLGIYLAKNRDEVLYALLAKKRPAETKPKAKTAAKASKETEEAVNSDNTDAANDETPAKPTRKRKAAAS